MLAPAIPVRAEVAPDVRAQIATRCDDLLRTALRSPFGWGWNSGEAEPPEPAPGRFPSGALTPSAKPPAKPTLRPAAAQRHPVIDGRETAVIGVELFWAGELLGEEKYKQAALEAARGLSSIQTRAGQVRAHGPMGLFTAPADAPAEVADRSATVAALGLWLTLIDAGDRAAGRAPGGVPDDPPANPPGEARGGRPGEAENRGGPAGRDARLTAPAALAARWLVSQQTPTGAWPVGYPSDAPAGKGARVVRLDTPEFRDTALALLLAADVLERRDLRVRFDKAADQLAAMRVILIGRFDPVLWVAGYDLQGNVLRHVAEFPGDIDLLATRHALQTLLAGYLVTLRTEDAVTARQAAEALAPLPRPGGKWARFYTNRGEPTDPPKPATTRPVSDAAPGFFPGLTDVSKPPPTDPKIDGVLRLTAQIAELGGEKVVQSLAEERPMRRRLVEMICGLSDDSLSPRLPGEKPLAPPASDSGNSGLSGQAIGLWAVLGPEITRPKPAAKKKN